MKSEALALVPQFALAYAALFAAVYGLALLYFRLADRSGERPPQAPGSLDPYEIAYLRGGPNAVVKLASFALRRQGLVREGERGLAYSPSAKPRPALGAIEERVLAAIANTMESARLFTDAELRASLLTLCAPYEARLGALGLLEPPSARRARRDAWRAGGAALTLAALYGLLRLQSLGAGVILTLASLNFVAIGGLWWLIDVEAGPRANARGRAWLKLAKREAQRQLGAAVPTPEAALLAVALNGLGILKGTSDAFIAKAFAKGTSESK